MKKVAMIIPYFGKFPVWFDLYLYSCSLNPQVDFIFYTDCERPSKTYRNTFFKRFSFDDYCNLVSKRLGIEFFPKSAYKLCDLKPFYGIIHANELADYEFWGFGDLDVVYGNLGMIINDRNLCKYDFITIHSDRVAGHFTIMRTKSLYTQKCFLIPDWKNKLMKQCHLGIDEAEYSRVIVPGFKHLGRIYKYLIRPIRFVGEKEFYIVANKLFCNFFTRKLFKEWFTTPVPKNKEKWVYDLSTGEIKKGRKALPYIHFLFFKDTPYLKRTDCWKEDFYKLQDVQSLVIEKRKIAVTIDGIYKC